MVPASKLLWLRTAASGQEVGKRQEESPVFCTAITAAVAAHKHGCAQVVIRCSPGRLWNGGPQNAAGCHESAAGNLHWIMMCWGCLKFIWTHSTSPVSSGWMQMMQDSTEITGIICGAWTDTSERLIMLRCVWTKILFPNSFEDGEWLTFETKSWATFWKKLFLFSWGAKQNPWISAYPSVYRLCMGLFKSISKILGFIWSLIIDCQLWCFIPINCRLTHVLSQVVHSS